MSQPTNLTPERLAALRDAADLGTAPNVSIPRVELRTLLAAADELVRVREALKHMQVCAVCAEGPWETCEGGREALAALVGGKE